MFNKCSFTARCRRYCIHYHEDIIFGRQLIIITRHAIAWQIIFLSIELRVWEMSLLKLLFNSSDSHRRREEPSGSCQPAPSTIFDGEQVRSDYVYFESRWKSFPYWFDATRSSHMAEAGFFYDGQTDVMECFHCRQSVHSWKITINPPCESLSHLHAVNCNFIKRGKTAQLLPSLPEIRANQSIDSNSSDSALQSSQNVRGKAQERLLHCTVYFRTNFSSEESLLLQRRCCDICNDRRPLVAFLCGHQYSCEHCATLINFCLMCHKTITCDCFCC